MRKISCIVFALLQGFTYSWAQQQYTCYHNDVGKSPREHQVDFLHLMLDISFDTVHTEVRGTVTHTFRVLRPEIDSLVLDAVNISVEKVMLDNDMEKKVDFYLSNDLLVVYLPSLKRGNTHTITIQYHCRPRKGIYFTGWNDPYHYSRRQIWTQGQGIDNRHWIPMFDDMSDKITTEVKVRFDTRYKVLSNGKLLSQKNMANGITEWHYKMSKPHAPYLIMIGIGDYRIKTIKSKSGINIHLWYYPDKEYCVPYTYFYSAEMMDFFEKEIGFPFPWEQYSQIPVEEFMYGAMENTTATVFGDFFLVDEYSNNDRAYVPVNAHELAHQWFGDLVTARSPAHVWLQESFATHYNWLIEKEVYGEDRYDWNRRKAALDALAESEKNLLPIVHSQAGTVRIYPKGAFVLHMLKYVLGRELYNASILRYLKRHAYDNVDTEDLWTAIYEETGQNLDWFFDQWLYRGGEPHYEVSFKRMEESHRSLGVFEIHQVQPFLDNVGVFKMPVVMEIHFTDGTSVSQKVMVDQKDQWVTIPFEKSKTIAYTLFDVNSNILKKLTFKKSWEELQYQAEWARYMIDRYDALQAMRDIPIEKKRDFLIQRYNQESFHALKEEIIFQLIHDTSDAARAIIKRSLTEKDPLVVRAVLANTTKIDPVLKEDYFNALNSKSYINIVMGMNLLYENFPGEADKILTITEKYENTTGRMVEIQRDIIRYAAHKDTTALQRIVFMASPYYEFRTRVNAFDALVKIGYFDAKIEEYLRQAMESSNGRLATPARETLEYLSKMKYK